MIRFAILFFTILVLFVALIAGPIVAGKYLPDLSDDIPMDLLQPTGQDNNDTSASPTGTAAGGAAAAATSAYSLLGKYLL